jgi:hypothetical protein
MQSGRDPCRMITVAIRCVKDVVEPDAFRHVVRGSELESFRKLFPGLGLQNLLDTDYFVSSFFRIRRSSIKQSPDVVQRTQPIMIITFMSIRAASLSRLCPANASNSFSQPEVHTPKDTAKCSRLLLPF